MSTPKTLATINKEKKLKQEQELREKCRALANERYGEDTLNQFSNKHKGLLFLPLLDDEGEIDKLAVLRSVTRADLSYASTKVEEDGLYGMLGAILEECWLLGDEEIKSNDEYFIPACNTLNKVVDGKKAHLLKR